MIEIDLSKIPLRDLQAELKKRPDALGKGLSIEDSFDFASYIRYETDLG